MAARVASSLARWRTMNVMRMDDVSWPAMRATMALSTISSSVSSRSPWPSVRPSRQVMRSLFRDALPLPCSSSAWLAFFFSRVIPWSTRRALPLALRLRLKAVNGRFTGTAHMPSIMRTKSPARASRTAPLSSPKSSAEMMSNVSRFMSGSTVTVARPAQFSSRWRRTSPSILPTYALSMSGRRNSSRAPRTRRWSAPWRSRMLFSPSIRCTDRGCRVESAPLKNRNLLAAGPASRTVGLPKRDSLDTGPYLSIRSCIHRLPPSPRMARRRPRLWPITGRPREPGGRLPGCVLLALARRWMATDEAVTTTSATAMAK
ncbi:unnamed protein product [Triticum aestivum]|uniref:Uncharacterized protein n=1 Tax=Triticum aestivum TaxID=4565 RepID=A0A7H4LMD4_WHEAT|nr:unnamed protein product [Triticum aestivum]